MNLPLKHRAPIAALIRLRDYAPILASARCVLCSESVMESRARLVDGQPACLACASAATHQLDGSGIRVA